MRTLVIQGIWWKLPQAVYGSTADDKQTEFQAN